MAHGAGRKGKIIKDRLMAQGSGRMGKIINDRLMAQGSGCKAQDNRSYKFHFLERALISCVNMPSVDPFKTGYRVFLFL